LIKPDFGCANLAGVGMYDEPLLPGLVVCALPNIETHFFIDQPEPAIVLVIY